MKTKFKANIPRTDGWKNQIRFDETISDLDISSLRFLKHKYTKEIQDFRNHFDLDNYDYQLQYKNLLQRKKMLDEEYEVRRSSEPISEEEWFNSENGVVYDKDGKEKYSIAYTEDEDDITYVNLNARASSECRGEDDETDYEMYEPTDKKEKYAKWDYVKLIVEDE
ncbi:MAG: hypothetical protein IMZ52_02765 [Actinobacteria bacterium]|nr:hypothetical protein [Actinomycetota bacterium]MBE3114839.1 hypothetical protein [Actinomycetota bacterium]